MRYVLCMLALLLITCEKGNPVINANDIITLHVAPSTIANFGDTALVTVLVTHSDGRPVLDGTRILLRSTGGVIAPEVLTEGGRITTMFTSDAGVGTFTITAQSGQVGLEEEISTQITVVDRSLEVGNLILNLNPSNISHAGGAVLLNALIQDPGGFPLNGVSAVFSSSYGRLASNGTPRTADAEGRASDTLFLDRLPTTLTEIQVSLQVAGQTAEKNVTVTTNQNPLPMITFSPANPKVGEMVFFDGSTSTDGDGLVDRYYWNFGDGTLAEGVTASHAYQQERDFQVTLSVQDDLGAQAATSAAVAVGANELPVPDFSISPDGPRVGDPVTFNAGASTDADGSIVDYRWTLGNGSSRSGQVITYAYPAAQTYQVTLTVVDNGGAQASITKPVAIMGNTPPSPSFSFSPGNPKIGERVAFDASASTDEDSGIKSFDWNFGDGFGEKGMQVNHVFNRAGAHVVTLTVTDNDNGQGFASQVVTVGDNQLPTAAFSVTPVGPRVGELVTFDGTGSSDPDGSIINFTWGFGDGSAASGPVVQHVFEAAQSYPVSLRVTDRWGASALISKIVTVQAGGIPSAQLLLVPTSLPPPGGQIFLDASASTDAETPMSQLLFNFRAYAPSHVSVALPSGSSSVRLAEITNALAGDQVLFEVEVWDAQGNVGRVVKPLPILVGTPGAAPVAQFSAQPANLTAPGGRVILDATMTTDADTPFQQLTFQWSYLVAGGVQVALSGGGALQSAELTLGQVGDVVTFLLAVEDPTGLLGHANRNVVLVAGAPNQAPTAALITQPSAVLSAGPSAQFVCDARASSDPEDANSALSFSFSGASTNPLSTFSFTPSGENGLSLCTLTTANAGDQLVVTVTVSDTGSLSDQASVILAVQ